MKKVVAFLLVILLASGLMCAVSFASPAKEEAKEFQYPILPGTEDWKQLKTAEEKRAACAVDPGLLQSMTTEELAKAVVTYPLLPDMYAYDTIGQGLKAVSGYFAGIDILLSRSDAADCLTAIAAQKTERTEDTPIAFYNADVLLRFIGEGKQTILDKVNEKNTVLGFEYAETFVPGFQSPARAITAYLDYVWTPNYTPVAVYVGCDWAFHGITYQQAKAEMIALMAIYPDAVKLSDPIADFNCHSYAWYLQSGNDCWMDYPNAYITDGSYVSSSAAAGAKVTYSPAANCYSHSGIVSTGGSNVRATSKWGVLGVVNHAIADCPYYSSTITIQYWQAA